MALVRSVCAAALVIVVSRHEALGATVDLWAPLLAGGFMVMALKAGWEWAHSAYAERGRPDPLQLSGELDR